jgi:hypothetical protein
MVAFLAVGRALVGVQGACVGEHGDVQRIPRGVEWFEASYVYHLCLARRPLAGALGAYPNVLCGQRFSDFVRLWPEGPEPCTREPIYDG